MSNPTKRSAKTLITIWYKQGSDLGGYGSSDTFTPITTMADYLQGGSSQFVANGVVDNVNSQYWFEYGDNIDKPKLGDFVAIGDHLTELIPSNIDGAEEIRQVNVLPADILRGNQLDDLHLVT